MLLLKMHFLCIYPTCSLLLRICLVNWLVNFESLKHICTSIGIISDLIVLSKFSSLSHYFVTPESGLLTIQNK